MKTLLAVLLAVGLAAAGCGTSPTPTSTSTATVEHDYDGPCYDDQGRSVDDDLCEDSKVGYFKVKPVRPALRPSARATASPRPNARSAQPAPAAPERKSTPRRRG